jgi:exopolyphosphatase / guanosine-5'-triphosphate,3'-diphosphate pyrophosphatase
LRLLEQFPHSNPPQPGELEDLRRWLREFFGREIRPALEPILAVDRSRTVLVGTGGLAKTLTRMEIKLNSESKGRIKAEGVPLATVSDWLEDLWRMSVSERKRLVGLQKKRADVIPFGAAIFEAALRELGFTHLRISKRGIRHAAVQPAPG